MTLVEDVDTGRESNAEIWRAYNSIINNFVNHGIIITNKQLKKLWGGKKKLQSPFFPPELFFNSSVHPCFFLYHFCSQNSNFFSPIISLLLILT